MTMQIRYMERDDYLRLQREAEAADAAEAEMQELRRQIAEQKQQLAIAEAELAEAEART